MSLAYFPLYPGDFEADTAHLTLAEDGAYNRLLRLCWRSPGCGLPNDRQWIYRRMRCLSEEDRAVVDAVLDEFFQVRDGRVSNARLSKDWLAANAAHKRRVDAGEKGGRAKALKTQETGPSIATAKPKQPEPEPEPKIREDTEAIASDAKRVWAEGIDLLSNLPERQARGIIGKWCKSHDPPSILSAYAACRKAQSGDPVPYITRTLASNGARHETAGQRRAREEAERDRAFAERIASAGNARRAAPVPAGNHLAGPGSGGDERLRRRDG